MTETIITGQYQISEKLGAGGMGTVYLGQDTRTGETVAIKQLKPELTAADLIERFKREGEALRDLNHPNIVKMLDAVEADDKHYLIMEYVSGGDLADLLKQGQMPVEQVLKLSIDLADALTRAHKLGIIHRDLKPGNVLIAPDDTLKLTDFGVAHVGSKERVTDTDAMVGTIDYLPPETFDGGTFDARGDIWAFGVMLFEMLAGERPFKGTNIIQVIQAIATEPIPDLETLRPEASTALIDLVYRMLERDPMARIASVRHVGAALEDILQGRSIHTPPATRFNLLETKDFTLTKHNLPAQVTEFVGREHELTELSRLLHDPSIRLMTILAPGGMGKTRLSLTAAEQALDYFEDGVYFVELAPLTTGEQIIPAIATALNFSFQSDGREQKTQIFDFLQQKQLLLVLDNFEHLLESASIVTEILNAAPQVQILVTSRQRTGQRGETIFHLAGMDFPDWETPEDALRYAAVKLFVNSARHANPAFGLTGDNLDSVARICRLVQGMPLGIVLSGAWVAMLSPQEIASELEQSMDILADGIGELPERQQSIRLVMDYSWQMMSGDEQTVFMKLSVFKGGFTREAAPTVAGANLRVLMSLVSKSLIRRDADSGRYEIHELLRQYAAEMLDENGSRQDVQDTHMSYYLHFVAMKENNIKGNGQTAALNELEMEFENIARAWRWATSQNAYEQIAEAHMALVLFFRMRSHAIEHRQLFNFTLDSFPAQLDHTTNLLRARIIVLRTNQISDVEEAISFAKQLGSKADIALFQMRLGILQWRLGDYELSLLTLKKSLDYYLDLGDHFSLQTMYSSIGYCYSLLGQPELALEYTEKALKICKESGNLWGQISNLNNIATILSITKSYIEAETVWREANQLYQQTHNRLGLANTTISLSLTAFLQGNLKSARSLAEKGQAIARSITFHDGISFSWYMKSLITSLEGDYKTGLAYANEGQNSSSFDIHIKNDADWSLALAYLGLGDIALAKKHNFITLQFALSSKSPTLLLCYLLTYHGDYFDAGRSDTTGNRVIVINASSSSGNKWMARAVDNVQREHSVSKK